MENNLQIWDDDVKYAQGIIKSGLLPSSINTPEKLALIIATGRELNIAPMQAIRGFYVIEKKNQQGVVVGRQVGLSVQLMLSLIYNSGKVHSIEIKDGDPCKVTMKRIQKEGGTLEYTTEFGSTEAKTLGLDYRDNYKKQPLTMYRCRAISACARVLFPDIIGGMYTKEELEETPQIVEDVHLLEDTQSKTINPEEYDKMNEEFFINAEEQIGEILDEKELYSWKMNNKQNIDLLPEDKRIELLEKITAKQQELITGSKPLSNYQIYINKVDEMNTKLELKEWFSKNKTDIIAKLNKEEAKKFVDYCSQQMKKLPE